MTFSPIPNRLAANSNGLNIPRTMSAPPTAEEQAIHQQRQKEQQKDQQKREDEIQNETVDDNIDKDNTKSTYDLNDKSNQHQHNQNHNNNDNNSNAGHHNNHHQNHKNKYNKNSSNEHYNHPEGFVPHMAGQPMGPYFVPMIPGQIPSNYNRNSNNGNHRNSHNQRNSKGGHGPHLNQNRSHNHSSESDSNISSPVDSNGNAMPVPVMPQGMMGQEAYAPYGYGVPYPYYPYPFNNGFPHVPITQGGMMMSMPNQTIPPNSRPVASTVPVSVPASTAGINTTAPSKPITSTSSTAPNSTSRKSIIKITRPDGTPTEFGNVDKLKIPSNRTSVVSQPTSPVIVPSLSNRSSTTSIKTIDKPISRGISIVNPETKTAVDLTQFEKNKKSRNSLVTSSENLKNEDNIDDFDDVDELKKNAEEEANKKAEQEAKKRAEQEEAKKRAEQEEAKKRAEQEAEKKAEQEAKKRAEEEAKKNAEEEAKKRAEEEAKKNAEEEAKKRAEEEAKKNAEEEATKKPIMKPAGSPTKKKEKPVELAKLTTQRDEIVRLESFDKVSYPPDIPSTPSREQGMPYKYSMDFLKSFANHLKERPKDLPADVEIYGDDSRGSSPRVKGQSRSGSISGQGSYKSSEEKDKLFQAALRAKSQQKSGQFGMQFGMRINQQGSSGSNAGSRQGSYGKPGYRAGRSSSGRNKSTREEKKEPVEVLKRSENAWTPSMLKKKDNNLTEEEQQADDVRRATQGLLNKLTVEMFLPIVSEFLKIPVTNDTLLDVMIDRIFNKALDEPTFGRIYAQLCRELLLKLHEFQPWIGDGKNSLFRRALLKKCQSSFQKDEKWNEQKEELLQAKREARTKLDTMTDEEKIALAEKEYELQKVQRRVLGNISFIGELFLEGLITEKIMHICIGSLLKSGDPSEEEVECLCQLLTTIGSILDTGDSAPKVNYYFEHHIKDMATSTTLSSRVRFMVMDLMDLRKSGWKDTKSEGPKSISEIHREEEKRREEERKDRREKSFRDRSGYDNNRKSNHGSDGRGTGKESLHRSAGDLSKVGRFQKTTTGLSLSPASNLGSGAKGWGKNDSALGKNSKHDQGSSTSINSNNSFAVLEKGKDKSNFTESVARSKFKGIVEECFSLFNANETVESLKDLPSTAHNDIFVEMILQKAWDSSTKSIIKIGPIIVKLVESDVVSKEQLIKVLNSEFEMLEDYSIDIPNIYKNVGLVLSELFDAEVISSEEINLDDKIIFE